MRTEVTIEQLLRWRLASAEADAPPRPRAAQLLAWAQPWWERYPERFQKALQSLMSVDTALGSGMAQRRRPGTLSQVPTLIVHANEQTQVGVNILNLNLRDGQLHFRFALEPGANSVEEIFEVTFVSNSRAEPVFFVEATRLVDSEYRLNADIAPELTEQWASLKTTDSMPFRLILRPKHAET